MNAPRNYYSAERDPLRKRDGFPCWRGWMQYGGTGPLTFTPGWYRTKADALRAIRSQHP